MLKDTHMEQAPSIKTAVLTKSMNVGIWVVGTLNQLFIRGSYTEMFKKAKYLLAKLLFLWEVHFVLPIPLSEHWPLTEQFCMEILCFQS